MKSVVKTEAVKPLTSAAQVLPFQAAGEIVDVDVDNSIVIVHYNISVAAAAVVVVGDEDYDVDTVIDDNVVVVDH